MSLPGPLTYEPKRFGSEREPPVRGPRPYSERLKLADELVEDVKVAQGTFRASLPTAAQILMVLGAVAPVAYAFPGAREQLFAPLIYATYPFSAGLSYASQWLMAGWAGALLILLAGTGGVIAGKIAGSRRTEETGNGQVIRIALLTLFSLVAVALLLAFSSPSALVGSVGAAWVIVTGVAGVYGARIAARRENWLGAVGGAVALMCGGRLVLGSLALIALVFSDKSFPGQTVALHPWKRSEVAIDPILPAPVMEAAPDEGSHPRHALPRPQALFLAIVALVFGAFAPVVLAIPAFGAELFGDLVAFLWPFSYFSFVAAGGVLGAVTTLSAGGPGVASAVFLLVWFLAVPVAGGIIAARAVARRRRRWAAVGGAVLLIIGARPIFGLVALVSIAYAWALFDRAPADAKAPKENAPGASAH